MESRVVRIIYLFFQVVKNLAENLAKIKMEMGNEVFEQLMSGNLDMRKYLAKGSEEGQRNQLSMMESIKTERSLDDEIPV